MKIGYSERRPSYDRYHARDKLQETIYVRELGTVIVPTQSLKYHFKNKFIAILHLN